MPHSTTDLWYWCTKGLQGIVVYMLRMRNAGQPGPDAKALAFLIQAREHLTEIIDKYKPQEPSE